MDDIKQDAREVRNEAKEALRRADGEESLSDKAANVGDDVSDGVANLGDDLNVGDDVDRALDEHGRPRTDDPGYNPDRV